MSDRTPWNGLWIDCNIGLTCAAKGSIGQKQNYIGAEIEQRGEVTMIDDIIYKDSLVELFENRIVLKNYYFPMLQSKEVSIKSIDTVEVRDSSISTGKYRFHGTGDIRTWYPLDIARNKRDKIFFLSLKNKWVRIGFTGENSGVIEKYFRTQGFIV